MALALILLASGAFAGENPALTPQRLCDNALEACKDYSEALRQQTEHLQDDVKKLSEKAEELESANKKATGPVIALVCLSSGLAAVISPPLVIVGPLFALLFF